MEEVLSGARDIELIGTASDPFIAAKKMASESPDVIILDIEMPRMDGLTFLDKIMSQHPIPVIVCSALAEEHAETTMKALEYGAVDIITKPRLGTRRFIEESRVRITDAVRAAASARLDRRPVRAKREIEPKLTADAVIEKAKPSSEAMIRTTDKVLVVGASTGGTEALRVFLEALPPHAPGAIIVQHMPEQFTAAFAKRLDALCRVHVKEAEDGDTVIPGRALIAPGNKHVLLKRSGARYYADVRDGPLVCRHRPSVDVLFRSAARYAGRNALGVIMTGMGDDGARGMLELHDAGAWTIAQDEETSVVFGMPAEAIRFGGVAEVLPLSGISSAVMKQS